MTETLKYYIAFTNGLKVMRADGDSTTEVGSFFDGKTLEHITGCRTNPNVVFAAVAFDGGYRTSDGGKSWHKILEGDVRTFTVDPHDERVIYAGAGPVTLYRSEDKGTTWQTLNGLLDVPDVVKNQWNVPAVYDGIVPPHVRHIFIHPDDQDLLYVSLEHGGIVVSRDRGESWVDVSKGIDYLDIHMLFNLPGDRERYFVSSARGFFKTENGGRDWRRAETGMPWGYTKLHSYSHEWVFCPGEPLRMVLGGAKGSPGVWRRENIKPGGHILLSDDLGETWHNAADLPDDMPWVPWTFSHHPFEPHTLYVGMGDGARGFGFDPNERGIGAFYRSIDRGETWDCILPDLPSVLTTWVAAD
ncbi:hypothetical protein OAJ57_04965 [Alphaproteobacteria bacterium]|nr:hypothetical protein [Alphaproteobacteria bacterium]